ncbi:MAG: reductive dehalogenase domain-containing protein [Pseudomonadota bacterium]
MKLFSTAKRPVHLGPYPLERLPRQDNVDLTEVPPMQAVSFRDDRPESLTNAMRDYQAMLDAIRDGFVKRERGDVPDDPIERTNHFKAFGYYCDASMVGTCAIPAESWLKDPIRNPDIEALAEQLRTRQTKTLAAGIDVIMADLKESMEAPSTSCDHHTHAIVFLYEHPRNPERGEPGTDWILGTQDQRATLRGAETAVVIASMIRLMGWEARAHTGAHSDTDLNRLAVLAGLAEVEDGRLTNPYLGPDFGLAAITTTLELAPDRPLAPGSALSKLRSHGPAWWTGYGTAKSLTDQDPYRIRSFVDGPHAFERLKRTETPTTFMDEPRIPRVPKRADMFSRAQFGDMGKSVQENALNGYYAAKSPYSMAARRPLGALVLLQDGESGNGPAPDNPDRNTELVKAALYFLGSDAVGISRCPDWAWYSHDALGDPIEPTQHNAISVIIDQGHETMEGASGDDWISCSQSMRAYLRFSLLGGVVANQIRRLGYTAKAHTVLDGEVLQPPLLLLSGLGEVSRIGEVILNPFLGPRLKSGVITTDMPLAHDKPIDFGLQAFCENCNKCARECPSGAITAGPKKMFNGYEIWKSDSQKCTTYRVAQQAGAMCGRCMKTCPWNLEGLFAEAPFRWLAMHVPSAAKWLAILDDKIGRGGLNPVKKWWWDLGNGRDGGAYVHQENTNARDLQTDLDLKFEDQTLAVYPANLVPPPYFFPFYMDREEGIKAHEALLSPAEYKRRLAEGETVNLAHEFSLPAGPQPVIRVEVAEVEAMTDAISKYEFRALDGTPLPEFDAGAHLDIAVSPGFFRQYSMSGDPADRSKYQIAVLREDDGRGGSKLLHRIFHQGRKVFISRPINHFPLVEYASFSLLMAGGIGVTPMIAMAHRLHALGRAFELHYSCKSRADASFVEDLAAAPWADCVHLHFSADGTRADLAKTVTHREGAHLYTCGPDRYMTAVLEAAEANDWPEGDLHREYFSVPEQADWENHAFTLKLARSGKEIVVPADQSATDALSNHDIRIDTKCSDGICGVCVTGLIEGEVEHRDFVLAKKDRASKVILCCSRAAQRDGVITIDL